MMLPDSPLVEPMRLPHWHRPLLLLMLLLVTQLLVFFYALVQPGVSWGAIGLWSLRLYLHLLVALAVMSSARPWLVRQPLAWGYALTGWLAVLASLGVESAWHRWLVEVGSPPPVLWQSTLASAIIWLLLLRMMYLQQRFRWQQECQTAMHLQLLSARLQPHFLFNTLNSIAALISLDPNKAERGVEQLSSLLRASLESQQQPHALANELRLIQDYLALEQLRLGERLRVRVDCPESLLGRNIPAMLLQPLVENAIKYGVAARRQGGLIELSCRELGRGYQITLMNPRPDQPITDGFGLALSLSTQRLQLYYQQRATLTLTTEGERVRLTLWLPESL